MGAEQGCGQCHDPERKQQAIAETLHAASAQEEFAPRDTFCEAFITNIDFRALLMRLAQQYGGVDPFFRDPAQAQQPVLIRYASALQTRPDL